MSGFVYKWTNATNGKWYYGSHKGSVSDGYIGSGKVFLRAYNKSKEHFSREIVYVGDDYREIEELILETLDAANDIESYNLKNAAIGGDTSMHFSEESKRKMSEANKKRDYSRPMPQETRDKIRQKLLGGKLSEETKMKLSESRKGAGNSFYGKSHSQEAKMKISLGKRGKKMPTESVERRASKMRKQIEQTTTGIVFKSIIDAGKYFNLHPSTISNMMNGHLKNRFELRFKEKNQTQ